MLHSFHSKGHAKHQPVYGYTLRLVLSTSNSLRNEISDQQLDFLKFVDIGLFPYPSLRQELIAKMREITKRGQLMIIFF